MKADLSPQDAHAPDLAVTATEAHDHRHEHAHGHAHDHAHGSVHRHGAAPPLARPSEPHSSLLMRSAALRLAGAVALSALLWAAVAWALSGTP